MRLRTCLIVCAFVLQMVAAVFAANQHRSLEAFTNSGTNDSADWPMYGRDLAGSHYNPHEKKITPETVARLKTKWIFEAEADVSSQPTVVDGVVYFGSGYSFLRMGKLNQLYTFSIDRK